MSPLWETHYIISEGVSAKAGNLEKESLRKQDSFFYLDIIIIEENILTPSKKFFNLMFSFSACWLLS